MTPAKLADVVLAAVKSVFSARGLDAAVLPETTTVERPRNPEHGDYASNLAMQLAKRVGVPPRELAGWIAEELTSADGVTGVEVAGPGFLNIRVSSAAAGALAVAIVEQGRRYGRSDALGGEKINLEFVSANPTGPIHLGHTRWAALGDSLHRILEAAGAEVASEHYINDAGTQLRKFAESLCAATHGEPVPDGGYGGAYVAEIGQQVLDANPGLKDQPKDQAIEVFADQGYRRMLGEMQASLSRFGVTFDVWFSERSLHEGGAVEHALAELRKQGHVFEHEGAVWLRTTDFGDDKDRVLIRSNGEKTYFAADAAYYINKRERGFDRCVYMLGADHHGYVGRLKTLAACAGDDPERNIEVLIGQMVKLVRDGAEVKLSKRAGNIVTLDELVDAVGVDAARYTLARYSADSPMTLDVGLVTRQSNENPVFYVQYVAARTAAVSRNAADLGVTRGAAEDFTPELLEHPKEGDLLLALAEFPQVVATAAQLRAPHRIARYAEELAGTYHRFYDNCRILPRGDEQAGDLHRARLWLNDATRVVIANGLDLLGVSAPERM
ncbi:MAG: arginine--tRNA ligase [Micromonosporaceae bacterium]|nr:arginine--tRNA ligase [Micromonosporaceae bacterium]